MSAAPRFAVLVVAKAPVSGYAKTRLSPPAESDQAADIAAASLLDTLDAVRATPGALPVVALSGDLDDALRSTEISAALDGLPVLEQGTGDLAMRLARILERTSELYPDIPVVLIGMDTPQVTAGMLADAADRLLGDGVHGLLGPAADGGWWLLGLRDAGYPPALRALRGTPMSKPDTGRRTWRRLEDAGLDLASLGELADVDTMEDAYVVARDIPTSRFAAAVARVPAQRGV